ncbi:AcrR family transcriptional regulator [Microbacterium endophyticum]|uniref:AcrR family transcriptional regulator n=1 Tax=Microbacterium endophyticum TaxID=1526412 RepID=A0A7W4V0L1_9MICO|nr:TetR/AcrR family transcriptional regulator [Microbacterium endophyticum]MBB2974668.1 AcrR family transcriptional regulator [Microbacterium endophyticum]NIK36965.1 AcrR family transcriptional regulator [Microbacterium endophyticum]
MRASSRDEILDAAISVVDADGQADITYQSVARAAGLTKAGLMYHFPTKDSMMIALIEHVIARWQVELQAALIVPLAETTLSQRIHAFVQFAGDGGATPGEFVVFSEAVRRPNLSAPWLEYLQTWFGFGKGTDMMPLLLVWLATNGLWIAEATGVLSIEPEQRTALISRLLSLADEVPST